MASLAEHTPQHTSMRETVASPLSSKNPAQPHDDEAAGQKSAPSANPSDTQNEPNPDVRIEIQTHTREVHIASLPNHTSGLMKDILENPALYEGRADF